ncbi:hypothetical protein Pmani_033956 [Petrolisthes manimaculis]|uniref:Uncharacterized protein n=1 Tax=Petrolisthes manimaculis TaxID=1843537 RepID=A0AAE1NNP8_9EUCA|nr:hypothetical protein Pmani_033956 [Petrolisthes manimaculis]
MKVKKQRSEDETRNMKEGGKKEDPTRRDEKRIKRGLGYLKLPDVTSTCSLLLPLLPSLVARMTLST